MSFTRSLFTVSSLTIVSRIAGFIRDTLTATFLGAGPVADAFFVAQRLPNLFRSLFAEGAFSAAFVPLYTTEQDRHGPQAAQKFAGQALALLLTALIPFSGVVMLYMPELMHILAPGFDKDPDKYAFAVRFSTITFPYLALISVTALQTGVLNAQGRFGPGAFAPITYNIVLIITLYAASFFHWEIGYALSWAVVVAGVVQMLWLMVSCWHAGVIIPLVRPAWNDASQKLFRRIGPGALGAGAAQINLLISTVLASTLPTGAVSYLFYADRLNQLPLGVIGIAVATTLLPMLSRHVDAGKRDQVVHYTSRAIEFCLMLGLPATMGLAVMAQPIIQTLFEHGAFHHVDTVQTGWALAAYALGIPAFLLIKVFAAVFFAHHDTTTPVRVAMTSMVVNVVASILLLGLFQHVGIALANSLAVWVNVIMLYRRLHRAHGKLSDAKLHHRAPRLIASALGMGLIAAIMVWCSAGFFAEGHTAANLAVLIGIISTAGIVYAALLHSTHAVRWQDVLAIIRRKPVE